MEQVPKQLLLTYSLDSIKFECPKCGKENTITRRSSSSATGVFCLGECKQHYWINWSDGVLHRDNVDETVELCTGFTEGVIV